MLEAKVESLQNRLTTSDTKASYLEGQVQQMKERNNENKEKYQDVKAQADLFNERLYDYKTQANQRGW